MIALAARDARGDAAGDAGGDAGRDAGVVLAPEAGAILGWRIGRVPILRPAGPEAVLSGRARGMGAYPLVPFSNRIGGGGFRFQGRDYRLTRADPGFATPIHGVGWVRRWAVVARDEASAVLRLRHPCAPADLALWPFPFTATLRVWLAPTRLTLTMRLVNEAAGPAPAGLGLHPYFPRPPGARLQFAATGAWVADAARLPLAHGTVPPAWDHAAGRDVGTVALDDVFTGWDGVAVLDLPPWRLRMEASAAFRHLVVFTPPGAGFFCVEPVSHMTDAVNREGATGLVVLAPGQALEGEVTMTVEGIG